MNQAIQFEAVTDGCIIRIPEQYIGEVPAVVKVTLMPANDARVKIKPRTKTGVFSSDDFTALQIDTQGWTFDREEANERR
jgi:hypothetical protein